MNFPVFSQLAGNFVFPETGSLETASSSGESQAPKPTDMIRANALEHDPKSVNQKGIFADEVL